MDRAGPGRHRRATGGALAGGLLAVAGGAAATIGALFPWVTIDGEPTIGLETVDGRQTLALGVVVLAAAIAMLAGRRSRATLVGFGLVCVVVSTVATVAALADLADIADRGFDPGMGMYLTVVGSVLGLVGGITAVVSSGGVRDAHARPPPPVGGTIMPPPPPPPDRPEPPEATLPLPWFAPTGPLDPPEPEPEDDERPSS